MSEETFTRLKVNKSGERRSTRSPQSDDQWDRGDTETDWEVSGVEIVDSEKDHYDVMADFKVKPGDRIWLVYAIYSTGDSFGNDRGSSIEFFTAHKNEEIASDNGEILARMSKSDSHYNFNAAITLDSGLRMVVHVPWMGYFEGLDNVHVEQFTVHESSQSRWDEYRSPLVKKRRR